MDRFSFLGDVLFTEGGVQEAVISRIKSASKKFTDVSAFHARKICLRVKGILYKSYERSTLNYGAECLEMRENERKLKTTKMGMVHMLRGKTLKDKVNNYKIREMTGVESIDKFLREQRLRWLGHVERMEKEKGAVKALQFKMDGTKKGTPKKR